MQLGHLLLLGSHLLAIAVTIATLFSFMGSLWWGFSFLEHPRVPYCLVLLSALLVGLISHQPWTAKRWILLWCLPLLINFYLVNPYVTAQPVTQMTMRERLERLKTLAMSPRKLSILHTTLDRDNPDLSQAIAYISQTKAQLVSLLEVTPDTLPQLQANLKDYQLIGAEPRPNSHGSAWFVLRSAVQDAQTPMQPLGTEVIHLPATSDRPLLKATVNYGKKTLHLLCFHMIRPRNEGTVAYQRVEFAALAEWSKTMAAQNKENVIIIGDFNSTPWYGPFQQMLKDSNLLNSLDTYGWQPTWHSALPRFLQIPIDHCLHSHAISTFYREIGPNIGSDHLPLRVDLRL